jgi:hypothetical protein
MLNKGISTPLAIGIILILAIIGGGIVYLQSLNIPKGGSEIEPAEEAASEEINDKEKAESGILEISIKKPNLIIKSQDLSKVEVYAIPTGTDIDAEELRPVGEAKEESAEAGQQVWSFSISEIPKLITHIFAKGFDSNGKEVGQVYLPVIGATPLYEALWGEDETTDWQTYRNEEYGFEI